jgi:hypothetical protein
MAIIASRIGTKERLLPMAHKTISIHRQAKKIRNPIKHQQHQLRNEPGKMGLSR